MLERAPTEGTCEESSRFAVFHSKVARPNSATLRGRAGMRM